jgi:hypothetical protein
MSITSWLEEFYPAPVDDIESMETIEVVELCINKWRGCYPENLKAHNLHQEGNRICEQRGADSYFHLSNCALCVKYHHTCSVCPVTDALGYSCDDDIDAEKDAFGVGWCEEESLWSEATGNESPKPQVMVAALEETITYLKDN